MLASSCLQSAWSIRQKCPSTELHTRLEVGRVLDAFHLFDTGLVHVVIEDPLLARSAEALVEHVGLGRVAMARSRVCKSAVKCAVGSSPFLAAAMQQWSLARNKGGSGVEGVTSYCVSQHVALCFNIPCLAFSMSSWSFARRTLMVNVDPGTCSPSSFTCTCHTLPLILWPPPQSCPGIRDRQCGDSAERAAISVRSSLSRPTSPVLEKPIRAGRPVGGDSRGHERTLYVPGTEGANWTFQIPSPGLTVGVSLCAGPSTCGSR